MKLKGKTGGVTEAGIHADSDYSPFIPPGTIPVLFKVRDGDNALCTSFHICLNEMNRLDALAAAVARADALSI